MTDGFIWLGNTREPVWAHVSENNSKNKAGHTCRKARMPSIEEHQLFAFSF